MYLNWSAGKRRAQHGSPLQSTFPAVPGTAVDRQWGSQQAVHFAAQAVLSGVQDVVVAGVEHMTSVPIGSNIADGFKNGRGLPMSESMDAKYGLEAEGKRQRHVFTIRGRRASRGESWHYQKANGRIRSGEPCQGCRSDQAGYFQKEIVPLQGIDKKGNTVTHDQDEGIRPNTTAQGLASFVTEKNTDCWRRRRDDYSGPFSWQICDGAAAILFCNDAALRSSVSGRVPKLCAGEVVGGDPVVMLGAPIPATRDVLKRLDLTMNDMDIYEVDEAFASVPMAWAKALGANNKKLNVNGGALALGHPLRATGVKLMTTLLPSWRRWRVWPASDLRGWRHRKCDHY